MSDARLAELIALSTNRKPSKICWRTTLTGLADEYMAAIDKMDYPGGVVGTSVYRVLTEELGISKDLVNTEKIRSHLRGDCRCPISKTS